MSGTFGHQRVDQLRAFSRGVDVSGAPVGRVGYAVDEPSVFQSVDQAGD